METLAPHREQQSQGAYDREGQSECERIDIRPDVGRGVHRHGRNGLRGVVFVLYLISLCVTHFSDERRLDRFECWRAAQS